MHNQVILDQQAAVHQLSDGSLDAEAWCYTNSSVLVVISKRCGSTYRLLWRFQPTWRAAVTVILCRHTKKRLLFVKYLGCTNCVIIYWPSVCVWNNCLQWIDLEMFNVILCLCTRPACTAPKWLSINSQSPLDFVLKKQELCSMLWRRCALDEVPGWVYICYSVR